jgi:hypothetical protein
VFNHILVDQIQSLFYFFIHIAFLFVNNKIYGIDNLIARWRISGSQKPDGSLIKAIGKKVVEIAFTGSIAQI